MNNAWKQRPEGGTHFSIALILNIGLTLGRGVARLILFPITLYFVIVRGPERRASRAYLTRVLGRPARLWHVARHIFTFSATILDRVFLLAGQLNRFDIRCHGQAMVHEFLDRGQGVLMIGSHLGSFEVMRVLALARPDVRVRVVYDVGQNAVLTHLLQTLNPDVASTVIDASQDGTAIVFAIKQAVDQGDLVTLLGDRVRNAEPALAVPFLASPAQFPTAPFLIASALHTPVVLAFGLYRGGNRYDLHFELFAERLDLNRRQRQHDLERELARYAARLEHYVSLAPYNWFNFYDFWQMDSAAPVRGYTATEPGPGA